ncbi:MAG: hypothetical protein ACJ702_03790 [Nitrososphaeraceae archaeon]
MIRKLPLPRKRRQKVGCSKQQEDGYSALVPKINYRRLFAAH